MTYQAEEEMTWETWLNSSYNKDRYYYSSLVGGITKDEKNCISADDYLPVNLTEIKSSTHYAYTFLGVIS